MGAIWFLQALFWALLIVRLFRRHCVVVIFVAAASWISARYVWLPLNLQSGGLASLLVYIGSWTYRQTDIYEDIRPSLFGLGLIGFCYIYFFDGALFLVQNKCTPVNLLASLFVVYVVLIQAQILARFKLIEAVLGFYGRNSLLVLCFHLFEFNCIPWMSLLPLHDGSATMIVVKLIVLMLVKLVFVTCGVGMIYAVKSLGEKWMRGVDLVLW